MLSCIYKLSLLPKRTKHLDKVFNCHNIVVRKQRYFSLVVKGKETCFIFTMSQRAGWSLEKMAPAPCSVPGHRIHPESAEYWDFHSQTVGQPAEGHTVRGGEAGRELTVSRPRRRDPAPAPHCARVRELWVWGRNVSTSPYSVPGATGIQRAQALGLPDLRSVGRTTCRLQDMRLPRPCEFLCNRPTTTQRSW